ncbi:MmgE/PrpD family protein [Candidatus Aerophobetes bacterium]|nr:MmgE/PrpD family protein [Candidatus Aerophobetes bacterium]
MSKVTQTLADFVVKTGYLQLTPDTVEKAKQCFLDWLGSALAGSIEDAARIMVSLIDEEGGVEEATVINHSRKNSCLNAALANAAMSHILELDDTHHGAAYHPAAAVIPSALAACQKEKTDGKTFLTSLILGYDASIRIGEAVGPSHYKLWHTTATCGNFGSCVAAGKVFKLNKDQMINALGNAGTQAGGLWEFLIDGAMSKQLHPAKAAQNGLLAALLARKGFTGARKILEGEKGFCRVTSENCHFGKITKNLGKDYKIMEVSFKPYASCRHTHSAIDGAKQLITNHELNYKQIAHITLSTYTTALNIAGGEKSFSPQTAYQAKFSLPFCVALALKYGKVSLDEFSEEKLKDKDIKELMQITRLKVDEKLDARYPEKWPCILEISTRDGKKYRASVDYPRGSPQNPLSQEELEEKFKELAGKVLSPARIETLLKKVRSLEQIHDMSLFFQDIF